MMRSALALVALALCVGCFILATDGTARSAVRPTPAVTSASAPTRVLMIGDSLSAGAFGEAVQQHLAIKFGPQNVAAFASCGSSPENWLAAEPGFYTKCGYRESTPDRMPVWRDFVNGKAPRPMLTPKIEELVRRYRPNVVVVQLGTNWMDRHLADEKISELLHRFVVASRSAGGVSQIIWIEPPDSSAFARVQARVHRLIQTGAVRDHFDVIDSRQLTHYIPGKTGGDGIHYNTESSRAWAARVNDLLDSRLRVRVATR